MKTTFVSFAALLVMFFTGGPVSADITSTQIGKILSTQGHYVAQCRVVSFKENDSGTVFYFRRGFQLNMPRIFSLTN